MKSWSALFGFSLILAISSSKRQNYPYSDGKKHCCHREIWQWHEILWGGVGGLGSWLKGEVLRHRGKNKDDDERIKKSFIWRDNRLLNLSRLPWVGQFADTSQKSIYRFHAIYRVHVLSKAIFIFGGLACRPNTQFQSFKSLTMLGDVFSHKRRLLEKTHTQNHASLIRQDDQQTMFD